MIFKASIAQAHGRTGTFQPGFGCTIADAVRASCSAYPFFERTTIVTGAGDHVELVDGGYCANNPTLYTTPQGTYVQPHQQTNPNGTQYDNYGARGNTNPYTGSTGKSSPRY